MTVSYNLDIPSTIMQLGTGTVDTLIILGLHGPLTRESIYELLQQRYPLRKRAANAVLKLVIDSDLEIFNHDINILRKDINPHAKLRMDTNYARSMCQILKFGD